MTTVRFEDALNYLVDWLGKVPAPGPGSAQRRKTVAHGSDVWIELVAMQYWQTVHATSLVNLDQDEREVRTTIFYDAAWELCRRGVLRPGAAAPDGQSAVNTIGQRVNASPFFGDGYALTSWGRDWVKRALAELGVMPLTSSRLTEVLMTFKGRFGDGFAQRASEAVSDWQTLNYLSACVMCGAAAESILLATAIAKVKDEAAVMSAYRTASGRRNVTKIVVKGSGSTTAQRFETALGLLSYWRDDAAHGRASTIGEIEAHDALSRLLRLAQFTSDVWLELTAPAPK